MADRPAARPKRPRLVLLAEDDAMIALGLELAILDGGFEVAGPVATVLDGCALVAAEHIDSAILDASLLDGDVTVLAEQLLAAAIPFLIHSAVGVPDEVRRTAPGTVLMLKPQRPGAVVERLRQLMDETPAT